MGREPTQKPNYEILAFVTTNQNRVLSGKQLTLLANDEEEQKTMTQDIAKAMKADVVQLKSKDYLIIRV